MTEHDRFVLATHNATKVAEYRYIAGLVLPGWTPVAYDGPEPVEDGLGFRDNALIKARVAAAHSGLPALADDSGLCVDVLGGAPGVFSAYWAGHRKDPVANRNLLLDQLSDVADPYRTARFTSALALVTPDGAEHVAEDHWSGRLSRGPAGDDGYPYDSIFVPDGQRPGHETTVAEWGAEERYRNSHRARAFTALVPALEALTDLRTNW
ncbi:dITP/XTP pyrophosphatase [Rhodococcus sp. RD6.2]|uniref:non-canonical purine NTP pyrophosphatase n=1 Tax=Rhodococcus sp. RD6.2 TaxID=260936 RepID=UPI00063BCEA1|nr:non-canonical purine NTP pyrophosphatase [Rhodococcus sp. RD6.2]CRK52806.1 dITP/XTP pyrophosphatase [Rhodococcus sp. RD6.2]